MTEDTAGEKIRQAQKMELVGALAPGIAHELNNPLTAILAFSQLLLGDPRLPDDLRDDARLLATEADRTQRLIKNLLDFVRERPPERQLTDVRVLIQASLDLLGYTMAERRIDVDVRIADGLPAVEVDRSAMQQVVVSLISVATHAISAEQDAERASRISIAAEPVLDSDGTRVRISVADDGGDTGPDADPAGGRDARDGGDTGPDAHPAGGRDAEVGGGPDGLAMAVASALVAAHHGTLTWRNDRAAGWRSIVEIPVRAEGWSPAEAPGPARPGPAKAVATGVGVAGVRSAEPPAHRTNGRSPRVLVLDDEAPIRGLLRRALQRHGFEATLAADSEEALAILRAESFDVLLVDLRMPNVDGLEFLRRAVEVRAGIAGRVVLMSGDVMDPALRRAGESVPLRVLGKPFELDAVGRAVAGVVESVGLAER